MRHTVHLLHNSNLEIRGFLPKALEIHCFLKKNSLKYIGINLTKCGFELHGFFLDPKTAHLEALLYLFNFKRKIVLQQGLEIRCFWFQKKTVQLKTALREVYTYVLKGFFLQKTVHLQGFWPKSVYLKVTAM